MFPNLDLRPLFWMALLGLISIPFFIYEFVTLAIRIAHHIRWIP